MSALCGRCDDQGYYPFLVCACDVDLDVCESCLRDWPRGGDAKEISKYCVCLAGDRLQALVEAYS